MGREQAGRADYLRNPSRRNAGREQTRSSRRTQPGTSHRAPTIVVRDREAGFQDHTGDRRRTARRRVDVTLSSPGAEIRLPALPVIQDFWKVISGVLTVLFLAAVLYSLRSSTFKINQVEVVGAETYSTFEIASALNLQGLPVFFITPEGILESLEAYYPDLAEIDVTMKWPASVVIKIQERHPVMAWVWGDQVSWIDETGVAFNPNGEVGDALTIYSTAPPPGIDSGKVDPVLVIEAEKMLTYLPPETLLIYDNGHGFGWQDENGWSIFFGKKVVNMDMKKRVYQHIQKHLKKKGIRPALVSVEYVDAPYYSMEY